MNTFVDTNVLVYWRDADSPGKQPLAQRWLEALWETGTGRLSTQVLNEYYVTVTRKLAHPMPVDEARIDVRDFMAWRPLPITDDLIGDAWELEDRYGISHWDALIVAAARRSGCVRLLSEDLQDGQDFDGVVVTNPFLRAPGDL